MIDDPTEERLHKVQKFLTFYFSPWDAKKEERWHWLTDNMPFNGAYARGFVMQICAGVDDLNWEALDD